MHVFGQWEEAGVPGENPCIHGRICKLYRKVPGRDSNREPFSQYLLNPIHGCEGGWSLSQLPLGERLGPPWACCQSITRPHRDKLHKQPHTLTLTTWVNLESPIMCFWTVERSRSTWREPPNAWGEQLHTERPQSRFKPGTLLLRGHSASYNTTVQPLSFYWSKILIFRAVWKKQWIQLYLRLHWSPKKKRQNLLVVFSHSPWCRSVWCTQLPSHACLLEQ